MVLIPGINAGPIKEEKDPVNGSQEGKFARANSKQPVVVRGAMFYDASGSS
jgi:hypothetical protein